MTRAIVAGALALCLLPSVSGFAATLGNVVEFNPTPVRVPASLSTDAGIRAVVRAFVMRSWRITDIDAQAGYVDAEYPIRVHVARVRAILEDGRVTFHYRDSDKIDHGWKVRAEKHPGKPDEFGRLNNEAWTWKLADQPAGPESTEMVHPKYLEWVEDVSRTLEGTFRLERLAIE